MTPARRDFRELDENGLNLQAVLDLEALPTDVVDSLRRRFDPAGVAWSAEFDLTPPPDDTFADTIASRLRTVLTVTVRVDLVPWGSLPRSDYKSKLVEHTMEESG